MPYKDEDQRRAYGRDWMRRNPDKARDGMRRWRSAHRDLDRQRKRDRYAADPLKAIRKVNEYQREHPEAVVAARERRRARELIGSPGFAAAEWRELVQRYGGRCAYCDALGRVGPDHRTPLSRGGTNAIENILPSCRRCNQRKYTLTEREFRVRLANERLRSAEFIVVDWWPAGEIESVG